MSLEKHSFRSGIEGIGLDQVTQILRLKMVYSYCFCFYGYAENETKMCRPNMILFTFVIAQTFPRRLNTILDHFSDGIRQFDNELQVNYTKTQSTLHGDIQELLQTG